MHLHSITGTCSTKDNGVERHNQSVSNFDDKASDNPVIHLCDNGKHMTCINRYNSFIFIRVMNILFLRPMAILVGVSGD
jgi:hypothetical protein